MNSKEKASDTANKYKILADFFDKANRNKIIDDLIDFGVAITDQAGNHVPIPISDGECEICAAEKSSRIGRQL